MTHYVIVRADLERGIQAAQIVHAAGESSPGNLPDGTYAVVLSAADEETLLNIGAKLLRVGIPFVPIYEPDAPHNGALMAIGVCPGRKEALKRHLSMLPLLK